MIKILCVIAGVLLAGCGELLPSQSNRPYTVYSANPPTPPELTENCSTLRVTVSYQGRETTVMFTKDDPVPKGQPISMRENMKWIVTSECYANTVQTGFSKRTLTREAGAGELVYTGSNEGGAPLNQADYTEISGAYPPYIE